MKKNLSKLYIQLIALVLFASNVNAHFGSKGPFGGTVNCAIVNDTVIYLGTMTGGVYLSANTQLANWTARPVGLKSGKINALTHTGSYLFAATDSGVYRFTGFVGNDRYWEKVNTGLENKSVVSLCAIDSITVLAGTNGDGVFKTVNNGVSWDTASTDLHHFEIFGMVKAGNRIIQISDGGLWATDDGAQTWFDFNDVNTEHIEATAVGYNSVTDELLIQNTVGLFVLSNASTTSAPAYVAAQTGLPSGVQVRSVSHNGSNYYLATNQGIFVSPVGTINWTSENTGLSTQDMTAVVAYSNQNRLVAGSIDAGVFKTPDSLLNWTQMNGGFNNLVTHSGVAKDTVLVVAATEKGVFVSRNLATSYTRANTGLTDSLHVNYVSFFGNILIAGTENAGVFMSSDTGTTWMAMNNGLTNMSIRKIEVSGSHVYIIDSANEIYRSDLLSSWTAEQAGLPSGVIPTSMAFYQGIILLGTFGDGIYTRNETSGVWAQFNSGLTNLNVTSVTLNDQNKIFAGTDGNGVFVSDATTINWSAASPLTSTFAITMDLDGSKIQDMAFYAGYVFASFRGEVMASSDNGATWIEAGTQFNVPSFADLKKLSFVTTRIFTTTPNNSMYSQGLSELPTLPVGIAVVSKNDKVSISPNPSNGSFSITINDATENIVALQICDATGKTVKQLENNTFQSVNIELAKGVYFVKLQTQKKTQVQKLIIH